MRVCKRALLALMILSMPVLANAEVSVIQDYCEQYVEGSDDALIIHFSVVNFSLPNPLRVM